MICELGVFKYKDEVERTFIYSILFSLYLSFIPWCFYFISWIMNFLRGGPPPPPRAQGGRVGPDPPWLCTPLPRWGLRPWAQQSRAICLLSWWDLTFPCSCPSESLFHLYVTDCFFQIIFLNYSFYFLLLSNSANLSPSGGWKNQREDQCIRLGSGNSWF